MLTSPKGVNRIYQLSKTMVNQGNKNSGVVLLVTLVLLVVLSTIGYILNSRVMAYHHRQRYMMDYQAAVYGRDSGLKYALATL